MTGLWIAEVVKLHSRASARVGLVLLALIGLLGPVLLEARANVAVEGNLFLAPDFSAPNAIRWSLAARSFYVAQAFLILLAAQSYAGELQSHTLREDLVRPVRRERVLLAKWGALATWSFLTIVLGLAISAAAGALLHPLTGAVEWKDVLLAHGAAWLADVGFAAVALAVSIVGRSVAGGIAGMFLFIVLERVLGWAMWAAHGILTALPPGTVSEPVLWVVSATPWLPSSAWSVAAELAAGEPPTWQAWVALLIWTTLAAIVGERVFARTDVP